MNLENLRRKRVQRLGVKTSTHTGQRRIFFILDRATKKFQGDIGLWMQYIAFARKQRSNKKVSQILTSVLRLHPTKPQIWIYAASYALEERGDMTEARSHMQRALRFCKTEEQLWVEYAKLEMMWIAKIVRRRKILGLDEEKAEEMGGESFKGIDGDEIALPKITAEDIDPDRRPDEGVDVSALEKLTASPALSGAIPIAIYDAAKMQFMDDEKLGLNFYDMVAEFPELPCTENITNHIMDTLQVMTYESPAALIRYIQQPVMSHSVSSHGFPTRLGLCLDRMKHAFERLVPNSTVLKTARPRATLDRYAVEWLLPYLGQNDLDPDVRTVILYTLRRVWNQFQNDTTEDPAGRGGEVARLIDMLQAQGLHRIAETAAAWAIKLWPDEPQLLSKVGYTLSQ